jgi:peroxiredoxin
MMQIGDPAPDASLKTTDGQIISLAETWRSGRHVLLIFLRHLG